MILPRTRSSGTEVKLQKSLKQVGPISVTPLIYTNPVCVLLDDKMVETVKLLYKSITHNSAIGLNIRPHAQITAVMLFKTTTCL